MIQASIETWPLGPRGDVLLLRVPRQDGVDEAFRQPVTGDGEDQETATAAAVREIMEETGLRVHPDQLVLVAVDFRWRSCGNLTSARPSS